MNNAGVSAPGLFESTTDIRNFAPAMVMNLSVLAHFYSRLRGIELVVPHTAYNISNSSS